ncbi:MAG: SWIM zinc finger family protein, partial [Sulfitobacter sp.]|nr:SWIM zinc finger family protein [Sulfitobacter sp.]
MNVVSHTYRYLTHSTLRSGHDHADLDLATCGGPAANPALAAGFVKDAQTVARMLLAIADVAATRFWMPPNMVQAAIAAADPVITVANDGLRFESFSPCGGVYARFDLDQTGFDGSIHQAGTTNVDVGPELRPALARVGRSDPLHLSVGRQQLDVATLDTAVVEKQVPLPERWIRGFAETAVATSSLEPKAQLSSPELRRFTDNLPTTPSQQPLWLAPTNRGLRLSTRDLGHGFVVGGIERLRVIHSLLAFTRSATVYASPTQPQQGGDHVAVWVLEVNHGRFSIALSPAPSRGFSGEGGLLHSLANGATDRTALASQGRLGYDVTRAQWFSRDLPYNLQALQGINSRLNAARQLVES